VNKGKKALEIKGEGKSKNGKRNSTTNKPVPI
jgi:hypothetical protein